MLRVFEIDPVYFGGLLAINPAIGANTPPLGIHLMPPLHGVKIIAVGQCQARKTAIG